jgi:hypothetical protein
MKLTEYAFSLNVMFDYNEKDQRAASPEERDEYEDINRQTYNYEPFADDEENELGKLYVESLNKYVENHPNKKEMEKTLQMDFSQEEINAYVEKYTSAQKEGKSFLERFHGWDATFILLIPWCIAKSLKNRNRFEDFSIFQVNVELNEYMFLWFEELETFPGFWQYGQFPKYEVKDGVGIIPEGTTKIVDYAFCNCNDLLSISIPDSITEIGMSPFSSCANLHTVELPNSITYLKKCRFSNCTSLKTITLPESLTNICDFDHSGIEKITIPSSVIEIGRYVFEACNSLKSVVIKGPVAKIEDNAFRDCTALKTIELPVGIKKIGKDAFNGCTSLKTINVPAKKADYYKKRLPESLHDLIVELPEEKKAKKK